ncbi:MAG: peptidase [Shimia sp.]
MSPAEAEARRWIGTPYHHRASLRGQGCDCLGLIRGIWRAVVGPEAWTLPSYGGDWAEAGAHDLDAVLSRYLRPGGGPVALFAMRRGALPKHLGVLTDACTFIHAYGRHGVVESPLSAPWARRIVARYDFPERS